MNQDKYRVLSHGGFVDKRFNKKSEAIKTAKMFDVPYWIWDANKGTEGEWVKVRE